MFSQNAEKMRRFRRTVRGGRNVWVDRHTGAGIGSSLKNALGKISSVLTPIVKSVASSPVTKELFTTGLQIGATELAKAMKQDPKAFQGAAEKVGKEGLERLNKLLGNGISVKKKNGSGLRLLQ
jgi:hypothetical protein